MSTLYLSRLTLDPRRRDVQRDLANCYAMHQRLLSAFPDNAATHQARERFGQSVSTLEQARAVDPDDVGGI